MKYKVKVGERTFEVDVSNLNSQPVIALVDGETVEVWLEDPRLIRLSSKSSGSQGLPGSLNTPQPVNAPPKNRTAEPAAPSRSEGSQNAVRFPIPGVIVSLSIREGDDVEPGQVLCVLEAMKMKNVIRASRSGSVAAVRVVVGQTVKHHDVLMEYAE